MRCGNANTKTPRSLARLDPVFPRDGSGRPILFPIKEESSRLATSSPFSKRANGKEPPRVGPMLPPTRAPLLKTPIGATSPAPSSRTLTHVQKAASLPVEQVEEPTLRDGPVMTPRPPARSAGRYSRKSTEESHLSSSGSSLEPPAPPGAARAASGGYSPKSDEDTTRETVGPDSPRAPEAWCPRTGTFQARTATVWCPRSGTFQAQVNSAATDELASSAFHPSLEYSTGNVVLFCQPRPIFAVVAFVLRRRRRVIFLRGAVYDGRKGQAFKRPSRSGGHHVVARSKRTQTHRSRRA